MVPDYWLARLQFALTTTASGLTHLPFFIHLGQVASNLGNLQRFGSVESRLSSVSPLPFSAYMRASTSCNSFIGLGRRVALVFGLDHGGHGFGVDQLSLTVRMDGDKVPRSFKLVRGKSVKLIRCF